MQEARGRRGISSYSFLTLALDVGEWLVLHLGCALPPGKGPGIHWIAGWVGLRPGLDTGARGKILCQGLNPGCPVCT
jgi:hypothetical protein